MSRSTVVCASLVSVSVLGAAAYLSHAGPLNPPAGAVASSYKTLAEVEPRVPIGASTTPGDSDGTPSLYKITQSGSYYLTGNVTGVSGRIGIEIVASGVTIDLNGFVLQGVDGSLDGIRMTVAGQESTTVKNGSVIGWDGDGVDLASSSSSLIHGVTASDNFNSGIHAGLNTVVSNCAAYFCARSGVTNTAGISTSNGCVVRDCTSSLNQRDGIHVGSGCTVTNCTMQANGQYGVSCTSGTLIEGCSVYNTTNDGIVISGDCVVRDNIVLNAGAVDGAGIHAFSSDNRIEGNHCSGSDRGIEVSMAGNFIARNTCADNTTNYEIAAGNVCLVVAGATSPAISGDSGGVSPGSTNPNANYAY